MHATILHCTVNQRDAQDTSDVMYKYKDVVACWNGCGSMEGVWDYGVMWLSPLAQRQTIITLICETMFDCSIEA